MLRRRQIISHNRQLFDVELEDILNTNNFYICVFFIIIVMNSFVLLLTILIFCVTYIKIITNRTDDFTVSLKCDLLIYF